MSFVVDPSSVSFDTIKSDIVTYVKSRPDYLRWKDFYESSAGIVLIDLLAGSLAFLKFTAIVNRRESYLFPAEMLSSVKAIAETLGYQVDRGSNVHVRVTVVPLGAVAVNITSLDEASLLGVYSDKDVIPIADYILNPTANKTVINMNLTTDLIQVIAHGYLAGDVVRFLDGGSGVLPTGLSFETNYYVSASGLVADEFKVEDVNGVIVNLSGSAMAGSVYVRKFYEVDAVIGKFKTEEYKVPSINDIVFRFSSSKVSSDIKLTLGSNVLLLGDSVASLIDNKYVVFSSPADSVDVVHLNINPWVVSTSYQIGDTVKSSFNNNLYYECIQRGTSGSVELFTGVEAIGSYVMDGSVIWETKQGSYDYTAGSILNLRFVELEEFVFDGTEVSLSLVELADSELLSVYKAPETKDSIKIRAPLLSETRFVIRGRNDYKKLMRILREDLLEVGARDVSPAVIELTYLKNDLTLLLLAEKTDLLSKLSSYRPFGVEPPAGIVDPVGISVDLLIVITLEVSTSSTQVQNDLNSILAEFEKKLGGGLDLDDVENRVEDLSYVKIARVSEVSSSIPVLAWNEYYTISFIFYFA